MYLNEIHEHIKRKKDIKSQIDSLLFAVYEMPIYGGINLFLIGLVAYWFGAFDSIGPTSIWAILWRSCLLIGVAISAYYVLRMGRMRSLLTSWIKVFGYAVVVGAAQELILQSSVRINSDLYVIGLGSEYLEHDPILPVVLNIVIAIAMVSLLMMPVARTRKLHRSELNQRMLMPVSADAAPSLWACVRNAIAGVNTTLVSSLQNAGLSDAECSRAGVSEGMITVMLVRSSGYTPGVVEDEYGVVLLVPRGLLALARAEPHIATPIMAHELAHVLHRDTELWHQSVIVRRAHLHRTIPMLVFSAIGLLLAIANGEMPSPLPMVMALLYMIILPLRMRSLGKEIRELRVSSERLADWAAALAFGKEAVGEAIKRYGGHCSHANECSERLAALGARPPLVAGA